jgi:hypothetical protein
MLVTNKARQLTGVSNGLGKRGSVRCRRAIGLRTGPWIFAGLLLWLLSAPFALAATQLPLDKPLRFGTDKVVELYAELARHRAYYLDVTFPFRDAQQRAYMRNIVGEATPNCKQLTECGIPTDFLVTVRNDDSILLKEERKVFGHYAFDVNIYSRNIIVLRLKPGNYTITVEPIDNPTEIMDVDAIIRLTTDARATDLRD